MTMTRLAPCTRSIAPPMPLTILPGIIQLARSPRRDTCMAPSTATSMWPPRIIAKDVAESKNDAPASTVTVSLPALIRSASTSSSSGIGTDAEDAVLGVQHHVTPLGHEVRHEGRQADAEVDVLAVEQFARHARGQLVAAERAHDDTVLFSIRLSTSGDVHDALDEDPRRVHPRRIELAGLDELFDLGDR